MKIVLTCGHPASGFEFVHEVLGAAGVAPANPSRAQNLSPASFHERLLDAHEVDVAAVPFTQVAPGKVWQELAVDLFLGNAGSPAWGWADARTIAALEFWKSFDPQVRFALVYSSPEFAIVRSLDPATVTIADVERVVATWMFATAELMRFYARSPDRCVLVNVSGVMASPARFVERAAQALAVPMSLSGSACSADGYGAAAIRARFAAALTERFGEAHDLYREVESAADLDGSTTGATEDEALQGWRELDRGAREAEGARAALGAALIEIAALRSEHAQIAARMKAQHEGLEQENELLLLQVQQMQDELEGQAATIREAGSGERAVVALAQAPESAYVDMRGDVDGDNWYYAEHDGRWAGPRDISALRVAALRDGEYRLAVEIVDAKSAEIVRGMRISVNGNPLQVRFEGKGVVGTVVAQFFAAELARIAPWELQFWFPSLISPAEQGSKDKRVLAVRVKSVRISRVS